MENIISREYIEIIFKKYGLSVQTDDKARTKIFNKNSNLKLEILGDSILNSIITDYLIKSYDDQINIIQLRQSMMSKQSLCRLAEIIELDQYISIPKENKEYRNNLEHFFEVFIGFLYLYLGYNLCKQFMDSIIEKEIGRIEIKI